MCLCEQTVAIHPRPLPKGLSMQHLPIQQHMCDYVLQSTEVDRITQWIAMSHVHVPQECGLMSCITSPHPDIITATYTHTSMGIWALDHYSLHEEGNLEPGR